MRVELHERIAPELFPARHHDARALADGPEWFGLLARHILGPGERVRAVVVRAGGRGDDRRVLLPCVWQHPSGVGAGRLGGLANYYLPDWRPLCSDPASAGLIDAALHAALDETRPATVRFENLAPDAPELAALVAAFERRRWCVRAEPGVVNWTDGLRGGYEPWLARRPGRVRSTLERRGRRFARTPGARLELSDGREGEARLARLVEAWETVYARSWKPAEAYPRFVPELIRTLAARGDLRLGVAWLGSVPIATQLWVVRRRVAFVYKLAYDAAAARYSAGSLLFAAMTRRAIEVDGVERLDFLSGDDAYKADWMDERASKTTLLAFDPRSRAGLAALVRHDLGRVRDAARSRMRSAR